MWSCWPARDWTSQISYEAVASVVLGGDFIKRDRKGLLFSTNSHVKSIAGRVLAVLGVFLLRCTDRLKLHFIRQCCRWHAHRERGSRPIFAKVLNYTSVSNERRNVGISQIPCVRCLRWPIFENSPNGRVFF